MKKQGILNSKISEVLSYMGHTDMICIADCGLPIPDSIERIDLSLTFGEPSFIRVLETVAKDMKIEKILLAEEIMEKNPDVLDAILRYFEGEEIRIEYVSHTVLKEQLMNCRAVIRTGEATPYANIILQAGCVFA